jgi:uncharacterized membrane protein YhdT
MKSSTWHAEEALLLLMSGGFFVHLINASRQLEDDSSRVGDVLLRPVDLALFLIMTYCAVALVSRSRQFARTFDMSATWRRLGYWAITAYVGLSLPGHVHFLLTGDTRFFDVFPGWFSLAILPVYAIVVAYVLTLRRLPVPAPPAAVSWSAPAETSERPAPRRTRPGRTGVSA